MRSRIFSYKKELAKQGFRSTGWVGIVYLFLLILVLPLEVLMTISSRFFDQRDYYPVAKDQKCLPGGGHTVRPKYGRRLMRR